MNFIKLPHKKTLTLLRKAVALSTAFLFLFNISAEAFVNIKQAIPQEVAKEIRTILSEAVAPKQTPKEYLKDVLENIEKTITESDTPKDDSKNQPKDKEENKIPEKLDLKTYEAKYKKSLAIQYEDYNKEIESQAKAALEEFDKTAAEEIEKQEKLLTANSENTKPKYELFTSNDFENNFNPTFSYRAKLDNYINKQKNKTTQTTNSNSLKIKPKDTTPQNPLSKNLTEKIRAGLKTNNEVSGITGQEYLFNKQVEEMETNKRRAKLDQINQKMEDLKEAIKEQRGLYENEIATWKANAFKKLEEEKAQMIKNIPDSYKEYAALYDREFAQLQKEEIALYKDLIHETIENFKKTAPNDYESKKTFLSILFYLTALKGSGWNKNNFITGEDRNYIKTFLYNNIAQKKNICTGYTKTEPVYSSSSSAGLYGGSPTAGKMFDNQWAKHVDGKTEFILNNPNECEIAISSLIPYANLDGDGYVISNFIREYWNQPMFGAILSYAVKAMAITKVRGKEALGKFIDEAIKKENEVRNSHNGFWETMNLLTMEGLSNSAMYDGKYCEHNLCLSADGGYDQPNVWEGVAEILLNEGFTDILKKVTDQCYITAPNGDYRQQYLKCGGIYPLLFGTLLYAPQLADSLKSKRPYSQQPGQEIDRYGHINYVSAEQAKSNKKANDNYDLLHKYGKAELMMDYIMGQSFEGMHPANKMRMTNLISKSEYRDILDPKHRINTYNADSKIYKKELNKYNAKQVVWGFTSYGDWLVALFCTKDLARIVFKLFKVTKVVSFIKILVKFKNVPMSFGKSVKLANLLKAKGISPKYISKVNRFRKIVKSPIQVTKSTLIERLGGESRAMIGSVSGRITGVKNGVLIGTNEVFRPVAKSYRSTNTYRQGAMGGLYSTHANNLPVVAQTIAPKVPFLKRMKTFILGLNPFIKGQGGTPINTEKLTLQIFDKKGNPVEIKNISVQDDILYVNDEMFKVFKASLPEEQLSIIADLVKQHKVQLGIDGIYVKPVWKDFKPTLRQKFNSLDTYSELVNIYDETGKVIMQLGLDRALPQEAALLEKLGVTNPYNNLFKKAGNWFRGLFRKEPKTSPKKARKSPSKNARLIYMDGALYLEEGGLTLTKMEELSGFSLPKKAVCNMTKGKQIAFLTDLFSMPSKTPAKTPLKFSMTRNKIWPVFFSNLLSYSAAGSGLLLTMEQKPFDMTSLASVTLGLFLPYITSFVAPVFAPLVSKWGARTFLNLSYGLAAGFLGLAWAKGYGGQVTYQTDEKGRVKRLDAETTEQWLKDDTKKDLIDKEGKLYKTKEQLLPIWPLYAVSFFTGLASSGVRASSNVLLKGYEVKKKSMTFSMLFKNLGGLTFTLIPFGVNRFASGFEIKSLDIKVKGSDKFVDFSSAYPVLFWGTLGMMGWLRLRMPKLATPGYQFNRADFRRPWQFLTNPKIYPYVGGMFLASSLEGYVLFKGTATFARERFQDPEWTPDNTKDDWVDRENAKFFGAVATAFPQILLRGVSPRKMYFGRGLFNSALLATGGTLLLLTPSQQYSKWTNAGLGTLAGFMVGFGTANAFQYSQKLIMAQTKMMAIPNARRDAQILYSMSNLGLALPFFYGLNADKRKAEYGEGEFDATRHTFHLPLLSYALGMGLILDAEINASRVSQGFAAVSRNLLFPVRLFAKPAAKYGAYIAEGSILTKQIREQAFGKTQPAIQMQTPKLNITPEPLELKTPVLEEKEKKNLNFIFQPLPQVPQSSPAFSTGQ